MTGTIARPTDQLPAPAAPRRKLPFLVGVTAIVVVIAVWVVAFSPVLGVRTVTVTGTRTLSVVDVRAAAEVPHGAALIRLDTAAIRRRVEMLPGIALARVSVVYPSTVRIEITERMPVGYLETGDGFVLVDRSGTQYLHAPKAPVGLPRFALPTGPDAQPSGQAVAIVAGTLLPSTLAKLAEVSANGPQSITLVLRDGRIVTWGSAERSDEKARLLPALLSQPGTRFDVSNPDLVVVR